MQGVNNSPVLRNVGVNLRDYRRRAGLSQAALAQRSNVSRRTIINLEAGDANVGLSVLDHLAAALGVGFVDLVSAPLSPRSSINELAWRGDDDDSRAVLLCSASAREEVQLWAWSLAVGERYEAQPDPSGWSEMILVTQGELRIEFVDSEITLGKGQHATYISSQVYSYINSGAEVVEFVRNVIS